MELDSKKKGRTGTFGLCQLFSGKRHSVRIIKFHLNSFIGLKPYNNYSPPANRKLHNSETIKMIIQVREIDREIREANNITDETM